MAIDPGKIVGAIEDGFLKMIPFFGDALSNMTPEQKRAFLLQLAEVIARGVAEGMVKGNQGEEQ
jgi:uncharacterized SAM-dependent methyltransferase